MDFDVKIFSHGKLLITSEYLVIDGAQALALPTKKGQWLYAQTISENQIHWISKNHIGDIWFEGYFDQLSLEFLKGNDATIGNKLSEILKAATLIDTQKTLQKTGWKVETHLDFPNNWGLGSSSTLLCNLAKWLNIDAYQIHFAVSKGSGYDIACGMESKALQYEVHQEKPLVKIIDFNPEFKSNIYFLHLNQKQISDKEVARYSDLKKELQLEEIISQFNEITSTVIGAQNLEAFETLMNMHETLLSNILQQETIKEQLFQMYQGGIVKSLGAWGGDFVMVTARNESDLDYFKNKGFDTILKYEEMIIG